MITILNPSTSQLPALIHVKYKYTPAFGVYKYNYAAIFKV